MKLVLSIIHRDDADTLMEALIRAGFRATRVSSTGGFLREGNATILVGTDEGSVPKVLEVIKANTHAHTLQAPPLRRLRVCKPGEVIFAAANVFVLDLDDLLRI